MGPSASPRTTTCVCGGEAARCSQYLSLSVSPLGGGPGPGAALSGGAAGTGKQTALCLRPWLLLEGHRGQKPSRPAACCLDSPPPLQWGWAPGNLLRALSHSQEPESSPPAPGSVSLSHQTPPFSVPPLSSDGALAGLSCRSPLGASCGAMWPRIHHMHFRPPGPTGTTVRPPSPRPRPTQLVPTPVLTHTLQAQVCPAVGLLSNTSTEHLAALCRHPAHVPITHTLPSPLALPAVSVTHSPRARSRLPRAPTSYPTGVPALLGNISDARGPSPKSLTVASAHGDGPLAGPRSQDTAAGQLTGPKPMRSITLTAGGLRAR